MTNLASDPSHPSPHDRLLPSNAFTNDHFSPTSLYSITFNPLYPLRIVSTVFSITAFIIFVVDGGDAFIAADIFLAFIIIHNILTTVQYSTTHIFKITVELRGSMTELWGRDFGPSKKKKTKPNAFIDVGLIVCLAMCLIIGSICTGRWRGAWNFAVVLGWFLVIIQTILVVATRENKSLTLTAKFNDLGSTQVADTKYAVHDSLSTGDTTTGRDGPSQTAADLV